MKESRSDKIKKARTKLRIFLVKNSYFIILPFVFLGSYGISSSIQVETSILSVIVTASSFIVAIIVGFLINSYYSVKQLRWEKLNRFAELQNELKDYTQAFYWFVQDLTRKHNHLDYRFPESIETLEQDSEWNYYNDDSVAVRFVRYLREFAGLSHDIPDFELAHSIINKERLEQMHEYIIGAGGLLSRYKHFKYILKSFKLKDTNDLDQVVITTSEFVEFGARKFKKPDENYQTLGYWEARISDCEELLSRMMANGRFVYSFSVFEIRRLGLNLLFLAIFGILLPITILMLNDAIQPYQSFLSVVSAVGFMTYLAFAISRIYLKLSSSQLSYH